MENLKRGVDGMGLKPGPNLITSVKKYTDVIVRTVQKFHPPSMKGGDLKPEPVPPTNVYLTFFSTLHKRNTSKEGT